MENNKTSEVILYQSFDLLPIYNFYKFNKTNDLRYLIYEVNVNKLPEIDISNLENQFINLLSTYDKIDFKRQKLFDKAFKSYVLFKLDGLKEQQCYQDFHNFRLHLDEIYKDFNYDNNIFANTSNLHEYIKQKHGKEFLINNRLYIFAIIKATPKFEFDLYKEKIFINKTLNINFDEKKICCTEFFILRDEAIKITKEKNGRQS